MKNILIALVMIFAANQSFAGCHEKALERMGRAENRAQKAGWVAGGLAVAAWGPGLGVVWFTFPGGPAIYGGLIAGAATAGGVSLYHKLRARHFDIEDMSFQMVQGEEVDAWLFVEKASKKRDKFLQKLQSADPTLSVDEIASRFARLDEEEAICTKNGRYLSDKKIAAKILNF